MKFDLKQRDNGYTDLLKRMRKLSEGSPYAEVGILSTEGAALAKGSSAGLTVFDVAEMNEFGLGVPERSFIRAFYDLYVGQAREFLSARLKDVAAGKMDRKRALHQFGIWLVAMCQKRIRDGIEPPNSDLTQKLKGSSTPLIDTGQLWTSITFRTSDEEVRPSVSADGGKSKQPEEKKSGASFFVSARRAVAQADKALKKAQRGAVKVQRGARRALIRTGKALRKAQREYRKAERIEKAAAKKFGRK